MDKQTEPSILEYFSICQEASSLYDENRIDNNLIMLRNPHSFEAEQFRKIRTKIFFPDSNSPIKSIMITGSLPEEGKSFVAVNLALSIAQTVDQQVLLIDGDLRRPCIHTLLGFGDVPGLSDYLTDELPLSSLLLKTVEKRLILLPAGKPPRNPAELLSSKKMASFLHQLQSDPGRYFVILDTPPPHITTETDVILQYVDGVVLVVQHKKTNREIARKLIESIGEEKIISVIVNQFDSIRNRAEKKYYSQY